MADLTRQIVAAAIFSALAVAAMTAAIGHAKAADMPQSVLVERPARVCPAPREIVQLYDEEGRPTVAGRTEYYYCVTGTTLFPGDIPPPPEYCCG
jgi:hypothetical protein